MHRRALYLAVTSVLFIALSCMLERPAHAYVDPGSSLLVFQSASAFVTAALFYFRRRIKALFSKPRISHTQQGTPR
jgi:hypothetical protein